MTNQLPRPGLAGVAAVEISADTISPVTAALRLHVQDRLAFILESVEGGARYGRYSMVGVRGRIISLEGEQAVVRTHDYAELDRFPATDPLEALRRLLPDALEHGDLPVSLASGVGYLSYEAAARFEPVLPVPEADPLGLPLALFHLPDVTGRLRPPQTDRDGLHHRRTRGAGPPRRGSRDALAASIDRGRGGHPGRGCEAHASGRRRALRGDRGHAGRGHPRGRDAPDGARAALRAALLGRPTGDLPLAAAHQP